MQKYLRAALRAALACKQCVRPGRYTDATVHTLDFGDDRYCKSRLIRNTLISRTCFKFARSPAHTHHDKTLFSGPPLYDL